ncbi:hypothetical protein VTK56DRAFT_6870 [Thermocarpiscus australiensis]
MPCHVLNGVFLRNPTTFLPDSHTCGSGICSVPSIAASYCPSATTGIHRAGISGGRRLALRHTSLLSLLFQRRAKVASPGVPKEECFPLRSAAAKPSWSSQTFTLGGPRITTGSHPCSSGEIPARQKLKRGPGGLCGWPSTRRFQLWLRSRAWPGAG